jgi:hypothetical protein
LGIERSQFGGQLLGDLRFPGNPVGFLRRLDGFHRGLCPLLSFDGRLAGEECRSDRRGQRQRAYQEAAKSYPKRHICREIRRVSRLPLGAKIGATIIATWLAADIIAFGLFRVFSRSRDAFKGVGYLILCVIVLGLPLLLWQERRENQPSEHGEDRRPKHFGSLTGLLLGRKHRAVEARDIWI